MLVTAAKLTDGADELVILPHDSVRLFELDLGFPAVRSVVSDRTGQDGADDETERFGSRMVLASIKLLPGGGKTGAQWRSDLLKFMRPARRPKLVFTLDGLVEQEITLRADQVSNPLVRANVDMWEVRCGWVAPEGRMFSTAQVTRIANPQGTEDGLAFPLEFPVVWPAYSGRGKVTAANDGNTDADPVVRIHGPCTDPRIENETVGRTIEFSGLTVAAGDYVELDMAARTARVNGLAGSNVYGLIDFPASQWWALAPGDNTIRYYPVTFSSPSQAEVIYQHASL